MHQELVRSDLHLQYQIELAQNGMVDGVSSTLPVSERLQRLRQCSSNFRNGTFNCEDLTAHPEYVLQMRNLRRPNTVVPADSSLTNLYGQSGRSDLFLSVLNPGSAQAEIQSSRCLLITKCAIDGVQDLLVMAEIANIFMSEQLRRRPDEVHICFYSLSGSKTTRPTPHPAAMLPSVHVFAPAGLHNDIKPTTAIIELCISGHYVIWELAVTGGEVHSCSVEVCNWTTGEVISVRTSPPPTHLPDPNPGDRVAWHEVYTGDRLQTPEGHFCADPSLSTIVLTFYILGAEREREHETHLLIQRATLLAQIRIAASPSLCRGRTGDRRDASGCSCGARTPPAASS